MYIAYENELGKINLNKGLWRVKDIEGLGFLKKAESVIRFSGEDGQELSESVIHSRIITIAGDILRKGAELERGIGILTKSGVLKIQSGAKQRKIFCRPTLFSAETSERNAVYQKYVLQLTADDPYFEDFEKKRVPLFLREDLVRESFTLPCVFTRRVSRTNVINSGNADTRPVICVVCEREGEGESFGIVIRNHTTGQKFSLIYRMKQGEEIYINFKERTVTSNLCGDGDDGNRIMYLSTDSFMSEFYFVPGVNDIETTDLDESCHLTAYGVYSNKYIEAVV